MDKLQFIDIFQRDLSIKKFTVSKWQSFFGLSVELIVVVWNIISKRLGNYLFAKKHLLWTIYFMRHYQTDAVNATLWHCDTKTWKNKVKLVATLLYEELPDVIF